MAVLMVCLTGCEGNGVAGSQAKSSGFSASSSNSSTPVIVTWQPADKTAEFLSAWRPKD